MQFSQMLMKLFGGDFSLAFYFLSYLVDFIANNSGRWWKFISFSYRAVNFEISSLRFQLCMCSIILCLQENRGVIMMLSLLACNNG